MSINIEIVEEYKLRSDVKQQIQTLLRDSFVNYPEGKHFFNQIPTFRFLVWNDEVLVGHMAIDYRLMTLDNEPIQVFGIVDLCVATSFQSQKLATVLLAKLNEQASQSGIDFILLIAERFDIYFANGFELAENKAKWLMLRDNASFGVIHRKLKDCLLVKSVNGKKWTNETVDFLGALF